MEGRALDLVLDDLFWQLNAWAPHALDAHQFYSSLTFHEPGDSEDPVEFELEERAVEFAEA